MARCRLNVNAELTEDGRRVRLAVRLYLSSFRMGNHPEYLVSLVDRGRPAVVIANAMDDEPNDARTAGVRRELDALARLGFEADDLDLRRYFREPERLAPELRKYGLIWARGGNVFMLRYALAASGADHVLAGLLDEDAIVYAGYSAGPCVLGPTLRAFKTVDDADAVPSIYGKPPVWDGLGVLDFVIVPHVDSPEHPETERCSKVADGLRAEGVPHRTLRDGEALVVDGSDTSVH
jgi:dipeptidase E